jgi:two-component system, chemotaxis family, sensor kinase CheA
MKSKEEEYREIFLAEALDNVEEVNRLLTIIEKSLNDQEAIHALFRITHTLKGNAAGMGYQAIAEMGHVLEDLFGEVRDGRLVLNEEIFSTIYKAVDVLSGLVNAVRDNREVKYKGIKTKIEVLINRTKLGNDKANLAAVTTESLAAIEPANTKTDQVVSALDALSDDEGDDETKVSFSDLVQVPVRKLDNLLNLVGELIIEKDRILAARAGLFGTNEYARLSRISSDLQYSVMDVRLVQVGFLFNKFHRVVRDAAASEKKDVMLKLEGTDAEIDRNVLQVISDSLIHLIRNSVGHGIESPEERKLAGKPKEGSIWLSARNENDAVIIEIRDDGKGLDHQKIKAKAVQQGLVTKEDADKLSIDDINLLIFEPGFSTAEHVTAISGRGVGMDVVKQTLDSIGGTIEVKSESGKGTLISLSLPSSMAVKSCLLFELETEVYALPLSYTESVISLYKSDIHKIGGGLVATHLNKNIAIVFLKDLFNQTITNKNKENFLQRSFESIHDEEKLEIVVVSFNNRSAGFVVDKLLQQKEIVEKPLMKPIDRVKYISGVTILGSGNVCLVLNVASLLQNLFAGNTHATSKLSKNIILN